MLSDRSSTTRLAVLGAAIASALAAPAPAAAANNCQGAPGTSAVEQYCEAILSADGDRQRPSKPVSKAERAAASAALPPLLRKAGRDGRAIARLVPPGTLEERAAQRRAGDGGRSRARARESSKAAPLAGAASIDDRGGSILAATAQAISAAPAARPELTWSVAGLSGLAGAGLLLRRRRPAGEPS